MDPTSNSTQSLLTLLASPSLSTLNLRIDYLGDEDITSLTPALSTNSTLTIFELRNSTLSDTSIKIFTEAILTNPSLTILNLTRNGIDNKKITNLAPALLTNSTLTALDLSFNSIGDEGLTILAKELLINSTLTELNLSHNKIDDNGITSLGKTLLINSTLRALNLSSNKVGNITSLVNALQTNSTLTALNLGKYLISEEERTALAISLIKNPTLTELTLFDLGDEGIRWLEPLGPEYDYLTLPDHSYKYRTPDYYLERNRHNTILKTETLFMRILALCIKNRFDEEGIPLLPLLPAQKSKPIIFNLFGPLPF